MLETADRKSKRRILYAKELPPDGFVRLRTVLSVFPIGTSTWWKGVKSGKFPAGVKLGPRVTAWRVSDIRKLLERPGGGEAA
jgi:predicted DNA-binding transcriptional regulator AlpA